MMPARPFAKGPDTRRGLQSIALTSDDPAAVPAAVHARHGIAYITLIAHKDAQPTLA